MFSRHLKNFMPISFSWVFGRSASHRHRLTFRPMLEALEEKTLPSGGTITTLTASAHEIVHGQSVTFTAVVSGSETPTSGVVVFLDGGGLLDGKVPSAGDGINQATYTTNALTLGEHWIKAVYGDDAHDALAKRPPFTWVSVVVKPKSTSLSMQMFSPPPAGVTGLTVDPAAAATPVTAAKGQNILIAASVTSPDGWLPDTTITFFDGPTMLGATNMISPLIAGRPIPATIFTNQLSVGTHTITAVYNWQGKPGPLSSQTSATIVITPALTATLTASADSLSVVEPVTFTAVIDGFNGSPTGTVSFLDGDTVLGTAPVTEEKGVAQATFTAGPLGVGDHAITARYTADGFDPSVAPEATRSVTVNPPPWSIAPDESITATGAEPGSPAQVSLYNADSSELLTTFAPFDPNFTGGVRVAVGDVNNDGTPDIVAAAGPGGGPNVVVFNGRNGLPLYNFFAFDSGFTGGVTVAVGDVNNDGFADIICGADTGGGPNVSVFSGRDGSRLSSFFAYDPLFTGGVNVAAGNVLGTGATDVIVGAGPGGGPHVTVFNGANGTLLASFFADDPTVTTGVIVAGGLVDANLLQPLIVAVGPNNFRFTFDLAAALVPETSTHGVARGAANSVDSESSIGNGNAHMSAADLDSFFAADPVRMGSLFVAV